jgi:hypothetical protein
MATESSTEVVPTRRRIELTPTNRSPMSTSTSFGRFGRHYDQCSIRPLLYAAELAPEFREFNVDMGDLAVFASYKPEDLKTYAVGEIEDKLVAKDTQNKFFFTEKLNRRGFGQPSGNATLFHFITDFKEGGHVISGFITSKRVVLLHHYRNYNLSFLDEVLTNYIKSQGREVVIYPPQESGINIQKTDNRVGGRGLCQRWFIVLPYAIAKKLGNNKANWDALGDTWEGSLVKEVYDEINTNPIKARYKYTVIQDQGSPLYFFSGGRRKTLSK